MRRLNAAERALFARVSGRPAPACLILRWPWWWGDFRGLALATLIVVRDDANSELIMHELTHVAQFRAAPWRFWWRYLAELRRVGYAANRYEQEARACAHLTRQELVPDRQKAGGPACVSSDDEYAASRNNRSSRY